MGPCRSPGQVYFEYIYTKQNWDCFYSNGIYATGLPNYQELTPIVGECAGPGIMENWDYINSLEYVQLQAVALYGQTSVTNRFQYYDDDWWNEDVAHRKSEVMDFGLVKEMNVSMYVGLFDNTCPLTQSQEIYEQLGPATCSEWIVAPW